MRRRTRNPKPKPRPNAIDPRMFALLRKRLDNTGLMEPTADGSQAITYTDSDESPEIEIDEANLYVGPRILSAETEDRDGDVLVQESGDFTHHKTNPVWYWEHGNARNEHPIGKCVTPDGQYAVYLDDETRMIMAGVTYHQSTKLAAQTFALVAERMIHARSISFMAHDAEVRPATGAGIGVDKGLLVTAWEMLEGSDVGIPSNRAAQERMLGVVASKSFQGETLEPSILQSMLKRLPARNVWSPGAADPEATAPAATAPAAKQSPKTAPVPAPTKKFKQLPRLKAYKPLPKIRETV